MDRFNFPDLVAHNGYGDSHREARLIDHSPPTPRASVSPNPRFFQPPRPQSSLKPRNITPPEHPPILNDAPCLPKDQPLYEEALAMVKQLEKIRPERPVSMTMSCGDFSKLMTDLKYYESNQKYSNSLLNY